MMTVNELPRGRELRICALRALERLGGRGTAARIAAEICGSESPVSGNGDYVSLERRRMRSDFEFDIGLAGAALQKSGLLRAGDKGVWFLTDRYQKPAKKLPGFLRFSWDVMRAGKRVPDSGAGIRPAPRSRRETDSVPAGGFVRSSLFRARALSVPVFFPFGLSSPLRSGRGSR